MDAILKQIAEWRDTEFGTFEFLQSLRGCVRDVVVRSRQQFQFLDQAPYLIAKLGLSEGILERITVQLNSVYKELHGKATLWYLDPDSPDGMRTDIDLMPAWNQSSPRL